MVDIIEEKSEYSNGLPFSVCDLTSHFLSSLLLFLIFFLFLLSSHQFIKSYLINDVTSGLD